jgi:hypothetical protein
MSGLMTGTKSQLFPGWQVCLVTVCILILAGLSGCQQDEITHYQVPKTETRLLAAIVPHGDRTWFFKLTGSAADVDGQKENFISFLQSVRFTDKGEEPVTWTVPDGWQRGKGSELRYATFRIKGGGAPLELTVIGLGKEAGSKLDNVNRWRKQLGLKPVTEADLRQLTQEIKMAGEPVTLVDMKGSGQAAMTAPFASRRSPREETEASRLPFTYRAPEGWNEHPPRDSFSAAAFRAGDGTEVTITPARGGLEANIARWRGQLGLSPDVTEEQLRKDCRPIDVDGIPAQFVDLTGPESARRQRILAVALDREDVTWFFKMKGPADQVAKQKSAFESFMASVRFNGSKGAKDE